MQSGSKAPQKYPLTLPLFRKMKSRHAIYQLTQLNFWKTCNSSSNNTKGETFPRREGSGNGPISVHPSLCSISETDAAKFFPFFLEK